MNHNTIIISIKHLPRHCRALPFSLLTHLLHKVCNGAGQCRVYYIRFGCSRIKCRKNPQHPRIKRSLATIHAISEIRQRLHRVAGVPLSVFKSPSFIAEVVRHYNSTFLSGKSDLKLDRRNLWRIFFRREYGRELIFLPHGLSVLHNAIYIQKRYNQSDEPVVGKQKRKR